MDTKRNQTLEEIEENKIVNEHYQNRIILTQMLLPRHRKQRHLLKSTPDVLRQLLTAAAADAAVRSEEHTSELQSPS